MASLFFLSWLTINWAQESLDVSACRMLALQNSPLQQKKTLAKQISEWQTANLKVGNLPKIGVGAQASWQSEVFGLPFRVPGSEVPQIPKDQYRLQVEASQKIYDGGAMPLQREQIQLEQAIADAQVEVDVFQLAGVVTDLFFKNLILQESENVLIASKIDLQKKLEQAEAAIREGVALRSSADQIRVQLLKLEQQIQGTQSDKKVLKNMLAEWIGKPSESFQLKMPNHQPDPKDLPTAFQRPEYQLFSLQKQKLGLAKKALHLRQQPKIEAFVQGGLGRPNPFNFFETNFQPFGMVGLRAMWSPWDWGSRRREAQVFDIQTQMFDIQQVVLNQRLQIEQQKFAADIQKWQDQLKIDDEIIRLQEDILSRADAQVKNGVMTMTDFLTQQNLLTQAKLARKTHEIQAAEAWEKALAQVGAEN